MSESDVVKSIIRRERTADGWRAFEPAAGTETVGHGDTELEAVIDYVEQLKEGTS